MSSVKEIDVNTKTINCTIQALDHAKQSNDASIKCMYSSSFESCYDVYEQ